ncbi:MAG: hypothetical protein JNM55_16370 [Anaerolineales bacterium]|nr:hypothetical protein [Anaerolineales bacterium]
MVGATLADWQKKREEEARRKAEAQEEKRANTEKRKAQKKAEDAVGERWETQEKTVAAGGKALYAPQKVEPPMPKGLSPETQAAYLHGGGAASSWINKNANTLQAQYAADLAKQKAQEQERLNAIAAARWTGAATIAQAQQAAQEQAAFDHRMDEHTGEQDKVDAWKVQQADLAKKKALEDFRAEERASSTLAVTKKEKPSWFEAFGSNFVSTSTNLRDNSSRLVGVIPDAWRGFLLSPLEVRKQIEGSNLVVSANQKALNLVSSVTSWIEKKAPWTGIKSIPSNKLGYYESLATEQGLDINPTGNLNPKTWVDKLLDIALDRKSKTLLEETTEGIVETTTKVTLRDTLKAISPSPGDAAIEGLFNFYDYKWGDKRNESNKIQKWTISSIVDFVGTVVSGGAATLTVAGIVALAGYIYGAPITVPLTVLVIAGVIAGAVFDVILEATGVKEIIKYKLNEYYDNKHLLAFSIAQPPMPAPSPSFSSITEVPTTPTIPPATMTPTAPPTNKTSSPNPTIQTIQTPSPTIQITQTPEP